MGAKRHYLTDTNPEARTAVCSACGPVDTIVDNGAGRPACGNRVRVTKYRNKIKTQYGVTWEQWAALLIACSGRCCICRDPMRIPHVDHCHTSGAVRGLLCSACNTGLGMFRDDVVRLEAAISYLKN